MARGLLSGLIWGGITSVVVAGGVSLVNGVPDAPKPDAPKPDVVALDVPAGSQFDGAREDKAAELPATQPDTRTPDASRSEAPETDDLKPLAGADTDPAARPDVTSDGEKLAQPLETTKSKTPEVATEAPVLPNPQASLPDAPTAEEELSISTDPAQPPLPDAPSEVSAFPPAETEKVAQAVAPEPEAEEAPASDDAPAEETEPQRVEATRPVPVVKLPSTTDGADNGPMIGKPAGTIGNLEPGVSTGLLPSLNRDAETQTEEGGSQTAQTQESLPPLKRFAARFDNPENKPEMAIVLIDQGDSPMGLEALASFPYPLTFAVDASRADAAQAMKRFRDAGFEVVALANIPQGSTAADVEVNMASFLGAVPEAVALLEGDKDGLQSSREISDQVTAILAASGHGLVFFPKGLNTAQKMAAKEGVPAASIFRDFDNAGQDAGVIRRFLDQAAFKAGQDGGGVIMLGRLRPDTISALLLWGLQDRAMRVALAPLSAVLSKE